MYLINNSKSVKVQTDTFYPNDHIFRNEIKIIQQKLKRKRKIIENLEDLLNNLKNRGLLEG